MTADEAAPEADSVARLRADLAAAGRDPAAVQWADADEVRWDDGVYLVRRAASGVVVTSVSRDHETDAEAFPDEPTAAAALRGRVLRPRPDGPPMSEEERRAAGRRMQAKARARLAELEQLRQRLSPAAPPRPGRHG